MANINLITICSASLVLVGVYVVSRAFYNVYLHPLSKFPGPKLWAASRIPLIRCNTGGRSVWRIQELHEQYGPIVRIAPDELTCTDGRAWKDIYGHQTPEWRKSIEGHGHVPPLNTAHNILTVQDKAEHSRMRRQIAHAFSDKALRNQEKILQLHVGNLISQLKSKAAQGPVDVEAWYNYTTFDAIGDLAFGESFGCLESSELHPWIRTIFNGTRAIPYVQALVYYRLIGLAPYLLPPSLARARVDGEAMSQAKLARRVEKGPNTERGDFLSYMLKVEGDDRMTKGELQIMAQILIVGGSETTATLLTGVTYHLLSNMSTYNKLVRAIRETFKSEGDIDMVSSAQVPYLSLVLDEGLRLFPPVAVSLPRIVPDQGAMVAGVEIPGKTVVGVHQWSVNRSPANFTEPNEFIPERWQPESAEDKQKFKNDMLFASQPFSVGPRNCIGRNLAYVEMRLIMARMLWAFDLSLPKASEGWADRQKTNIVWEKGPLMVHIQPRKT